MNLVAALPMYDWPEARDETEAEWLVLRERFRACGIEAPEKLVRRNAELPAVPGGIRDREGKVIAPDPASLPPDELNVDVLWRHPNLLCAQTCWGPMELGLLAHVKVIGQPDYSRFPGGEGEHYRSAIVMRRSDSAVEIEPPDSGKSQLPVNQLRGLRFAYNEAHSMSGFLALRRDLAALAAIESDAAFDQFWFESRRTGSHRQSVIEVAEERADVAAIDCRTLALCRRFEPATGELAVVGWTALRRGLPYVGAVGVIQASNLSSSG